MRLVARSAPPSARVIPRATVSRAGPRARSASRLEVSRRLRASSTPVDDLAAAQQQPGGGALRGAHDVGAGVHAVGEVGVQVPRLAEHHRIALGLAAEGVRPGIVGAVVGLDLGDPQRHGAFLGGAGEYRAEQQRGDLERAAKQQGSIQHRRYASPRAPETSASRGAETLALFGDPHRGGAGHPGAAGERSGDGEHAAHLAGEVR